MEPSELAYYELYDLAEEANEEIKRMINLLPQPQDKIYSISAKLINNYYFPPNEKYMELAKRVRCASAELAEFRKRWDELTRYLEAIGFTLFLAEGHALVCDRRTKRERYNKEWHGRYKS